MEDKKLDELIDSALPEAPPDNVAREVTPWRRAMTQLLWGLALTTITFTRGILAYVLPTAGMLMMLCGLRTLRRENGGFRAAYICALAQNVVHIIYLTSLSSVAFGLWPELEVAISIVQAFLKFAMLLMLYFALKSLKSKAGLSPSATSAAILAFWYAVPLVFGMLDIPDNSPVLYAILIVYIIIIVCLWRTAKSVEAALYAVTAAGGRISNRALAAVIVGVELVGIALGLCFLDKYPMDWQPRESGGETELRAELSELGFPEGVLADLTDEEVRSMSGARYVLVDEDTDTSFSQLQSDVFDGRTRFTTLFVRMPGHEWRVVCHFEWVESPGFHGAELFRAQLGSGYIGDEFWAGEPVSGRVLYDRGGVSYAAPYHDFGLGTRQVDTMFFGRGSEYSLSGSFSFPNSGERQRGYLVYTMRDVEEDPVRIAAQPHYWRANSWFVYPALPVDEPASPVTIGRLEVLAHGGVFPNLVVPEDEPIQTEGVG